jgi:hypothetical protein
MDDRSMIELAQHIKRTHDIREASYVPGTRTCPGWYAKGYESAAVEAMVPEKLRPLIFAMLVSGFADVHEWCDSILNPYGDDVTRPAPAETISAYIDLRQQA